MLAIVLVGFVEVLTQSVGLAALSAAVGLVLLIAGGDALVRGATRLAQLMRFSPAVIGLTIVAAGTSAPELVVSVRSAVAGTPDLALGNVVGSNIFNIGAILGIVALIRPLRIQGNTVRLEWPVMMLAAQDLRVVPLTVHLALSDVPAAVTQDMILRKAHMVAAALRQDFGIGAPRLAVAGLNPHAGEGGAFGREEIEVILPAIERLKAEGLDISGPHPADTMFHDAARKTYDAALCMYHDQALIPLKTLDFYGGVNVTLGLPIVRTSPDHGTALNIAGHGIARPDSLISAIKTADKMVQSRGI